MIDVNARDVDQGKRERTSRAGAERGREAPIARIRLLYESRDGRLCLFEDADGHLTAVRAAKLA